MWNVGKLAFKKVWVFEKQRKNNLNQLCLKN